MYLGIDLGTSQIKVVLIDENQQVTASAHAPLSVSRPHEGWSEQDPADWIAAAETVLDSLVADHGARLAAVRGIGLSGQMHGATLLDGADRVLRPAILWNDTRSRDQAARLDADPAFRAISGNIVFPGFTAPKLLWLRDNEPRSFEAVSCVLLPKDHLRLWLTGERASDMSDASGTSWLDTGGRRWSAELVEASGMRMDQLPRLVEGTEPSGCLRKALADRWGMSARTVVAGGAGDNAASGIGTGTIAEGTAFVSLGTSGVLFAANERLRPSPETAVHAFCHALPDTWHQMGVMLSATAALDWLAGVIGVPAGELVSDLGEDFAGPAPLLFLPYLSGERTPHNDAAVCGALVGIAQQHDRPTLVRAVLDGVAFALRDNLEALRAAGTGIGPLLAVGGGSRSSYWLKVIATALGVPVTVPADGDLGAAFGAARLGLIAADGADPSAVCRQPETGRVIAPDEAWRDRYETQYERFRALYPTLAEERDRVTRAAGCP